MAHRIFGVEVEYGFAATDRAHPDRNDGSLLNRALESFLWLARENLVNLPGPCGSGMFLQNGSRLYVDCGHPEIASPEVADPTDCCRYVIANDAIARDLVNQLNEHWLSKSAIVLWKGNVDYAQPGVSFGCHESYLHACSPANLPQQLIPHLVSRVYLASGGLDTMYPGIRFSLFPRSAVFKRTISGGSTSGERGIYHTRNESHAGSKLHRCHVICGDTTQLGLWLKVASTALIVALVDVGLEPGSAVYPKDPVQALEAFSGDPTFQVAVPLANGGHATALDIQRHYLAFVESRLGHPMLPPWAEEACRVWRRTLDQAAQGPAGLERSMDWAIKYALFQMQIRRHGFDMSALAHFNHVLDKCNEIMVKKKIPGSVTARNWQMLLNGPLADHVTGLKLHLANHGLRPESLADFIALRSELCELDTRFSQITPTPGLFSTLMPHLAPIAPMPAQIDQAKIQAPTTTRARIRGKYVQRYAGRAGFSADWTEIRSAKPLGGRRLDLTDPFGTQPLRWQKIGPSENELFLTVERLFREGRYASVLEFPIRNALSPDTYILTCARLGRSQAALSALQNYNAPRFNKIALSLCAFASIALTPAIDRMVPLIEEGDRLLAAEGAAGGGGADAYYKILFLQNKGRALCAQGRHDEAITTLQAALQPAQGRPRNHARVQMYLAEAHRLKGRLDDAARLLLEVRIVYQREQLRGDLADYALPLEAKLATDAQQAGALLQQAERIQADHRNDLGLARVLCVKARRLGVRDDLAQIRALFQHVESLRSCPTAQRIQQSFDQWLDADRGNSMATLDYWGI